MGLRMSPDTFQPKTFRYFALNPGWLTGILLVVYFFPVWLGSISSPNITQPGLGDPGLGCPDGQVQKAGEGPAGYRGRTSYAWISGRADWAPPQPGRPAMDGTFVVVAYGCGMSSA